MARAVDAQVTQTSATSMCAKRQPRPLVRVQGEVKEDRAGAVQAAGQIRDPRGMANGAANQGEKVVVAERAFQAALVVAEQADEERLHQGDDERIPAQEDPAAKAIIGVEERVTRPERQDRVEHGTVRAAAPIQVHDQVGEQQPEPADLDRDRLGGQFPARGTVERESVAMHLL